MEQFCIKNHPNYLINKNGEVWSIKRNKVLKNRKDLDGRFYVCLNGVEQRISKLMAYVFLGEAPKDLINPIVDHYDNNKENNHISNLFQISSRENSTKDNNNKSGYSHICKRKNSYYAYLNVDGKLKRSKTVNSIEMALLERDKLFEYYNIPKKFRDKK